MRLDTAAPPPEPPPPRETWLCEVYLPMPIDQWCKLAKAVSRIFGKNDVFFYGNGNSVLLWRKPKKK
jgi:hypothetical protein